MILSTTTIDVIHHVGVRHASTGAGISTITASLVPEAPYGWSIKVRGSDVIVLAREGVRAPPVTPTLSLRVVDPRVAASLAAPEAEVSLDDTDMTLAFAPIAMSLEVTLVDTDGDPRSGLIVKARATRGPNPRRTIDLAEASAGVYRSAAVTWTDDFHPFDLTVDGNLLRKLVMDFTRPRTRIQMVDTT